MVIFGHFLKMGGKCPGCHLYTSCKWEENVGVPMDHLLKNGRKMSVAPFAPFLKTGGKCPGCYQYIF